MMQPFLRIALTILIILVSGARTRATSHTNIQTVFIILMENVSWPDIVNGTNAPYINSVLVPQASLATNMFIVSGTFGSLPQYLYLESGTNWGVTNNSSDPAAHHFNTTNHLTSQLQSAGISWKAYQESISGTTCPTASSGLYAAFHNPFVYFDDVYLDTTNCTNHIRPYSELTRDLTNSTVARYNFITPNLCSDMHGNAACPGNRILLGDQWLSNEIPKILASPAFTNRGALIVTWDEGTANVAGPYATLVLSPLAKGGGYRMADRLDHNATFRTLQEIFHVPLLFAAKTAPSLSDLFKPTIQFSPPVLTSNRAFQFTITGLVSNKSNLFQFTTNFPPTNPAAWVNLFTNTVPTNSFTFIDTNANNAPRRFYRVLESY